LAAGARGIGGTHELNMAPTKKKDTLEKAGKRLAAVSTIGALLSMAVFSAGPCATPEWKFITKAEAASVHEATEQKISILNQSLSRIEGKLDALISMTKEILQGDEE
tara:strand:- start:672 stop:992 length:321 start_codon:yes stop_codon:yes gene_type:complete